MRLVPCSPPERRIAPAGSRLPAASLTPLNNLANRTLKARMPVEETSGANRRGVTHLEAFGRLIAGLAPWLDVPADGTAEGTAREYGGARAARLASAVDPRRPTS